MERKTKHRILGIFVVIAIVIISLPLFQTGKDVQTQTALVQAPPFPDQSVQVTTNPTTSSPIPINAKQPQSAFATKTPPATNNSVNQQPDDTIPPSATQSMNSAQMPVIPAPNLYANPTEADEEADEVKPSLTSPETNNLVDVAPIDGTKNPDIDEAKSDVAVKEDASKTNRLPVPKIASSTSKSHAVKTAVIKHVAHTATVYQPPKVRLASNIMRTPLDNNGLFKLKNAVWVIQLGSFKNKANALRLVNQLRASGYRAFIQEVAANTRVYVGPELKQNSARSLASRLEADMKLRGIVISYKPLTL